MPRMPQTWTKWSSSNPNRWTLRSGRIGCASSSNSSSRLWSKCAGSWWSWTSTSSTLRPSNGRSRTNWRNPTTEEDVIEEPEVCRPSSATLLNYSTSKLSSLKLKRPSWHPSRAQLVKQVRIKLTLFGVWEEKLNEIKSQINEKTVTMTKRNGILRQLSIDSVRKWIMLTAADVWFGRQVWACCSITWIPASRRMTSSTRLPSCVWASRSNRAESARVWSTQWPRRSSTSWPVWSWRPTRSADSSSATFVERPTIRTTSGKCHCLRFRNRRLLRPCPTATCRRSKCSTCRTLTSILTTRKAATQPAANRCAAASPTAYPVSHLTALAAGVTTGNVIRPNRPLRACSTTSPTTTR